jgi:hypothetical protein
VAYIMPSEPADHVVMVVGDDEQPDFTWGDHRRMLAMLQEMEDDNPVLAAARKRLDDALKESGWTTRTELICQWCHQPESKPHEIECRDHNDPALWVKREAAAYQYLTPDFVVAHTTSVPMTDVEALEYFSIVELMFPGDEQVVKYITRKAVDSNEFKMMPWQFDLETWEVSPIDQG